MKFLSLFSGIEAASAAWVPLGWQCVGFSEIDPFCCALLRERYPQVKNYGDVKALKGKEINEGFDLLIGGSPCQDFSVAGCRAGLSGKNSKLATEFVRIAGELHPRWIVWENVPGAFSTRGGQILPLSFKSLAKMGLAWRGLCLTRNFSECRKPVAASSLSDIIETGDHLQPFCLTARGAVGILSRLKRKDRNIPQRMLRALFCSIYTDKTQVSGSLTM